MEILSTELILASFLIFVRVGAMVMTAPFFSSSTFPVQVKLFFAILTSILLYPVIPAQQVVISPDTSGVVLMLLILGELLVGAAMGLVGQLIFAGLELAGRLISLKIVLAFAELVDSMTQQKSTLVGNLFGMIGILVFLAIDGDKIYLSALAKSFELIPVHQAEIQLAGPYMLEIATYLFVIGVQVASPFMIVLFLLDLSLAIFARIMPQANVMFIALPLKLGIGFLLLLWIIPYLPVAFELMLQRLFDFLQQLVDVLAPLPAD